MKKLMTVVLTLFFGMGTALELSYAALPQTPPQQAKRQRGVQNQPRNNTPQPAHPSSWDTHNRRYAGRTVMRPYAPRTMYNLPMVHQQYYHQGINYFFSDGLYFMSYNGYFVVCRPPIGMIVPAVMLGNALNRPVIFFPGIPHGLADYYYSEGTFYVPYSSNQFMVVAPPMGALVESIPSDSEGFIWNSQTYYKVDDTYYTPASYNGVWMYLVKGDEIR